MAKSARKVAPAIVQELPLTEAKSRELARSLIARDLVKRIRETGLEVAGFVDVRRWINKHEASDLLKLSYGGQRQVRVDQVKALTTAMNNGSDYAPNNIIAFSYNPDNLNDTTMVVGLNGQHTLHSIIQSGKAQPLIISLFPCRTLADIQHHYAVFDQGKGRNQIDVSRAAGLDVSIAKNQLPKAALSALGATAALMRARLIDSRFASKDKWRNTLIMRDWMFQARQVYETLGLIGKQTGLGETGKQVRRRLVSSSLFAVCLVSMRSHVPETIQALQDLAVTADRIDRGEEVPAFLQDAVEFLCEAKIGSGTDRRILTRNFIHILVALRGVGAFPPLGDLVIDSMPSVNESEALWDVLTEDRLSRAIVNV